jgi:hypothetical protein
MIFRGVHMGDNMIIKNKELIIIKTVIVVTFRRGNSLIQDAVTKYLRWIIYKQHISCSYKE